MAPIKPDDPTDPDRTDPDDPPTPGLPTRAERAARGSAAGEVPDIAPPMLLPSSPPVADSPSTIAELRSFLDQPTQDLLDEWMATQTTDPTAELSLDEPATGWMARFLNWAAARIHDVQRRREESQEHALLDNLDDDEDTDRMDLSEDGLIEYRELPTVPGALPRRSKPVSDVQRYEFSPDDPEPEPGTLAHRTWEAAKAAYDRETARQRKLTSVPKPQDVPKPPDPGNATGAYTREQIAARLAEEEAKRELSEAATPQPAPARVPPKLEPIKPAPPPKPVRSKQTKPKQSGPSLMGKAKAVLGQVIPFRKRRDPFEDFATRATPVPAPTVTPPQPKPVRQQSTMPPKAPPANPKPAPSGAVIVHHRMLPEGSWRHRNMDQNPDRNRTPVPVTTDNSVTVTVPPTDLTPIGNGMASLSRTLAFLGTLGLLLISVVLCLGIGGPGLNWLGHRLGGGDWFPHFGEKVAVTEVKEKSPDKDPTWISWEPGGKSYDGCRRVTLPTPGAALHHNTFRICGAHGVPSCVKLEGPNDWEPAHNAVLVSGDKACAVEKTVDGKDVQILDKDLAVQWSAADRNGDRVPSTDVDFLLGQYPQKVPSHPGMTAECLCLSDGACQPAPTTVAGNP